MQNPLILSAVLHFAVIALMILGLPPSDRKLDIPPSIPVELVNPGDISEAAQVDEGEESPEPPAPPRPSVKPAAPQAPAPPPPAAKAEAPPPPPAKAPEPPKLAEAPPQPREPLPPPPPPKAPEPPKPPPPPPPAPTPEPTPKVEPPKPEPKKPEPPKPEPPKPEPPKPEPPKPEPPKPEPKKPEPPKPEPKKPEPPKPEPKKPEPAKPEPKKPQPAEDPLAKLLGDVAKLKPAPSSASSSSDAKPSNSQTTSSAKPSGAKTASQGPVREFKPSGRATDAIRGQLSKLWNVDTGRRNDGDMKVVIHVEVGPDGTVLSARMDDASLARAGSDRAYRASAEAAVRAVLRAQKLNLLPEEFTPANYANWRNFVFTFDPRDMF